MAKLIKADARNRHTKQKPNARDAAGHAMKVAYDDDNTSEEAPSVSTTSAAKPRNALVAFRKQIGTNQTMIETLAYYKAEKRDFAPGGEVEDWLEAEAELGILG